MQPSPRTAYKRVFGLVVIAIVALLVSLLLPVMSSARETAKAVKCGSNLHGLNLAQPRSLRLDGKYPEDAGAARQVLLTALPDVLVVAVAPSSARARLFDPGGQEVASETRQCHRKSEDDLMRGIEGRGRG